jgi:hypothetical protein
MANAVLVVADAVPEETLHQPGKRYPLMKELGAGTLLPVMRDKCSRLLEACDRNTF